MNVKVTRAHSGNSRPEGRRNWVVTITGAAQVQRLVFPTHPTAMRAADEFARTGMFDPIWLLGAQRTRRGVVTGLTGGATAYFPPGEREFNDVFELVK